MEQPVARSRGRPRKRRKEDEKDGKSVPDAKRQALERKPVALVGRYVLKKFPRNGVFLGKVVYYECGLYRVIYEDGDFEDLESAEIRPILISDAVDFDVGLIKRRTKLEKLVLQNRAKAADVADMASPKSVKEESAVDVTGPSELDGGLSVENDNDEDDGADDDLSSVSVSDVETAPLPPPLLLPPSSGTIGVPELSVSHLFSVYGFLRSFSTRLFLHPFTLDDFVGSLKCQFSNTLFDAIHFSLMRVLRRHLETLSPEGSELASQCLRCYDWNLLDTLTWPVFVILYLLVNGFTKGPEWKGFYDEVFSGEYYLLPVSRKLVILQILCDDVLESDELKTEMNMRKESEVGMDYDAEDILPAETGPRKVHPRYARTSFCEDKEAIKLVSASIAVNQPCNSISHCREIESTGDGDADRNGDDCRLCGMDGTLLCCDGCPSAYHSRCIGVMKMFIPEGPWYCPECKINMAGPTIAKGTSLRGAEIFGKDLYGQLFMGTCDHLLVLNIDNNEVCLRYYNQKDIPKVVQVLYESMLHRPMYYDICMAVLQYWNVAEKFLPLPASTETNIKDESQFPAPLLPPPSEENHKPVSLVQGENSPTTASLIHNSNMVSSLDALEVITQSPALDSSGIARSEEGLTMNKNLGEETRMEAIISAGSVSHQSNLNFQNSVNMSTAIDATKCSLINSQLSNCVHANDMGLPLNFSSQNKESAQLGFGKSEYNANADFCYMGFLYKPMSYINYYMHGDFSASAASKFVIVSSEESRSEGLVSDSQKKTASAYTYMQAKAFSLAASRFFWPSSEKKLVEVPRERCGWCISCKAPVASKRGCMLNHALISATKSAVKILATFSPIRSGEGILPSTIATYLLYMENCLHGLVVGPFTNSSFRKNWRKQVEHATTFSAIKPLLLKLEENIRVVAFCGDWVKLMDDWLVEFPTIQSATSTLGTTQKRAPSGRRNKKKSSIDEATVNVSKEGMWWRGGKVTKYIFQSAALTKSMVRKAARQGGSRKISGVVYADGSEIPKRSRQLVWRAAVQMSRNASQLALQVRCLDSYLRWSDLIRPEQNIQEGKGQETEASAFRNANICDKKLVEGKVCYGIAFGSQKHLPNRVMKSVVEKEQFPLGKEKYWFSETRIPLYLVKEYEEGNEKVPCEEQYSGASQLHRRRLKGTCKGCNDIFFYLVCRRDNLAFSCSSCQMGISIRNAHKCNACQGYCHEDCSISSVLRLSTNGRVECLTTCKRCHHAKLLAPNVTSNESPTSPLILQRQENSSGTGIIFKGPRPKVSHSDVKQVNSMSGLKGSKRKSHDQTSTSTKKKNSHSDTKQAVADSTLASSNRRNNNCSWGIIWKKRNNEDTNIDFTIKNILLKGGSNIPDLSPVCHLCKNDYRSDLMYICCETCQNWYHAEAVELEESKISNVLGFKCCKCRRIKSPVCPYPDSKPKSEVKKSRRRASKKQHSGPDSDSGAFNDMRESEPATPVFPVENDPLLFSLANVELITEPNKLDSDVEWNTLSMPGPQKLPVRRHVKHEGGDDGSVSGIPFHDEFSTYSEAGNMSNPADSILPLEYDSAVFDSNLLSNSEFVNNDDNMFNDNTIFDVNDLLRSDDSQIGEGDVTGELLGYNMDQNDEGDVPGELLGYNMENSVPEEYGDGNFFCSKCLQTEPGPEFFCGTCGVLYHGHCLPWPESASDPLHWTCQTCRDWQ
ncbi:unnamed protein product [Lathyrus oleraceus]|uniref:Uncharacterized protein n=1 Tax=Pisum sativum TaxID=3888 RepID=A0A9D4VRG3_PEA|nr:DDT domain-containing protein PTM-like [Pisum sativum]KAI5388873.1 hypothetical protein KIW84_074506 [Pisum sativum]